jgi:hypothetical protein
MRYRLCLAAAALFGACARPHATPAPEPDSYPDDVLVLEVDNHNWSDVLIYIVHDGQRTRFLEVTATRSITQPIPAHLVSSGQTVQFFVHRIGGRDDSVNLVNGPQLASASDDYMSPRVSVRTGTTVSLTLESNLQRSSVGVW